MIRVLFVTLIVSLFGIAFWAGLRNQEQIGEGFKFLGVVMIFSWYFVAKKMDRLDVCWLFVLSGAIAAVAIVYGHADVRYTQGVSRIEPTASHVHSLINSAETHLAKYEYHHGRP